MHVHFLGEDSNTATYADKKYPIQRSLILKFQKAELTSVVLGNGAKI